MKTIILSCLLGILFYSCKKGAVDDMYPDNNSDIIIQDSTVSGVEEVSPESLDETLTDDTTYYNKDSIILQK